jgi:hypothetical protein
VITGTKDITSLSANAPAAENFDPHYEDRTPEISAAIPEEEDDGPHAIYKQQPGQLFI